MAGCWSVGLDLGVGMDVGMVLGLDLGVGVDVGVGLGVDLGVGSGEDWLEHSSWVISCCCISVTLQGGDG